MLIYIVTAHEPWDLNLRKGKLVSRIFVLICKEIKGIKTFHSAEGGRETTDKDPRRVREGKLQTNVKTLEALVFLLSLRGLLSCRDQRDMNLRERENRRGKFRRTRHKNRI